MSRRSKLAAPLARVKPDMNNLSMVRFTMCYTLQLNLDININIEASVPEVANLVCYEASERGADHVRRRNDPVHHGHLARGQVWEDGPS